MRKDHRGDLDLEVRIEKLQQEILKKNNLLKEKKLILTQHENALKSIIEENGNLKVIISKLQDEKLELQKTVADLQHQQNIKEYNNG